MSASRRVGRLVLLAIGLAVIAASVEGSAIPSLISRFAGPSHPTEVRQVRREYHYYYLEPELGPRDTLRIATGVTLGLAIAVAGIWVTRSPGRGLENPPSSDRPT